MALHVTGKNKLFTASSMTATNYSSPFGVSSYIEGRIFISGDVASGTTVVPSCEQEDPASGLWFPRTDLSFTTWTGGSDQKQMATISNLGSRLRLKFTMTAAASPIANITATFEGKT